MKVRDKNGRILKSGNPVVCGMWKKAGYEELPDEAANNPAKKQETRAVKREE